MTDQWQPNADDDRLADVIPIRRSPFGPVLKLVDLAAVIPFAGETDEDGAA